MLVLGFILYLGEKKYEYKNKFDYLTFIFGKPKCRGHTPKVNYSKILHSLIKY